MILGGTRSSELINTYLRDRWHEFSRQNYFDEHGIFMGVVWAGPLLLLGFTMLVSTYHHPQEVQHTGEEHALLVGSCRRCRGLKISKEACPRRFLPLLRLLLGQCFGVHITDLVHATQEARALMASKWHFIHLRSRVTPPAPLYSVEVPRLLVKRGTPFSGIVCGGELC